MMKQWMGTAVLGLVTVAGSVMLAQDTPMPTGDTTAQDKMFLKASSEGGLTEITESKLALKKSKNPEIRAYAQQMITDHTKILADAKPFDDSMGVMPATKLKPEHQQEVARLNSMSGAKFDKEYVKAMVADHHKDRGDFRDERDTTSNADLKMTVATAYDVIKEHTDHIDAIAAKMNIPTPQDSAPISQPAQ